MPLIRWIAMTYMLPWGYWNLGTAERTITDWAGRAKTDSSVTMSSTAIHSLNARDNVLLQVARDYFDLGSGTMQAEIRAALAQIEEVLNTKGISYADLKTALVPAVDRREAAFVFERSLIRDAWYGFPIHEQLIPLFSKASNHSVLVGDYIGPEERQAYLLHILSDAISLGRTVQYHHTRQFHIVYVNNLTDSMIASFHGHLVSYAPYVGFADLTYGSPLKVYLSTILVNHCLINRHFAIVPHEDDLPNDTNINTPGYPFEESGFDLRSVQSWLFGLFLAYKIERPLLSAFEADTEFSLNAISSAPGPLEEFSVIVEPAKFDYLLKQKTGAMKRASLAHDDHDYLERLIRAKLSSNYIYNLRYDEEHDTSLFDILIEFNPFDSAEARAPVRVMVALEYMPHERVLRVVTLY